jgi:hypothetical protein
MANAAAAAKQQQQSKPAMLSVEEIEAQMRAQRSQPQQSQPFGMSQQPTQHFTQGNEKRVMSLAEVESAMLNQVRAGQRPPSNMGVSSMPDGMMPRQNNNFPGGVFPPSGQMPPHQQIDGRPMFPEPAGEPFPPLQGGFNQGHMPRPMQGGPFPSQQGPNQMQQQPQYNQKSPNQQYQRPPFNQMHQQQQRSPRPQNQMPHQQQQQYQRPPQSSPGHQRRDLSQGSDQNQGVRPVNPNAPMRQQQQQQLGGKQQVGRPEYGQMRYGDKSRQNTFQKFTDFKPSRVGPQPLDGGWGGRRDHLPRWVCMSEIQFG